MNKRLYKIEEGKVIDGVCGGIAEYFKLDPTIVRLIWVLICLAYGVGIIVYIVAMFIMPKKSDIDKDKKSKKGKIIDIEEDK